MMPVAAQEDTLPSPITSAADSSETTTILVSCEGSGLPWELQKAFDKCACPHLESCTPEQDLAKWYV
jgi:hypothetical protein